MPASITQKSSKNMILKILKILIVTIWAKMQLGCIELKIVFEKYYRFFFQQFGIDCIRFRKFLYAPCVRISMWVCVYVYVVW